jgi:hypothetical protein
MEQGKSQETSHLQEWVFKLIESLGVTPDFQSDPVGFQFESEGRIARVFPHEGPTLAVAEVEVCSMLRMDGGQVARAGSEISAGEYLYFKQLHDIYDQTEEEDADFMRSFLEQNNQAM